MGEEKMINQFTFTVLVALAWLSEFLFGSLILYWFITQGLSNENSVDADDEIPLESPDSVVTSLGAWVGFFVVLIALIVLAS